MPAIHPLRGIRYNPEHVRLGGVLAPPYDVISAERQQALYGRDLRNIVRIDFGLTGDADQPGIDDRYTRARGFLESWLRLGILQQDADPSIYVTDHEFVDPRDGSLRHRRGVIATVRAAPWEVSELRPHERTLTGPKADRLALLQATHVQTSPVFALWTEAPGVEAVLDQVMQGEPAQGGRTEGELGSEKHLLWRAGGDAATAFAAALRPARLYVADGHHRYETAVAYAQERRTQEPDAPAGAAFEQCLVYLSAAGDPALTILPTHRLVRAASGIAFSLDDLWARLDDAWEAEPAPDLHAADTAAAALRARRHAFAVVARDGAAVLSRERAAAGSPRDGLDVTVLEQEVLAPAGVSPAAIAAGALAYTRSLDALEAAVRKGAAVLGVGVQPVAPEELVAVADAGETMPQKSTYFYPKVPTGLVLAPL